MARKRKINSKSLADKLFPIESVESIETIDIPPEKRRLLTETYDFSIATLHSYLTQGSIFLPDFQRRYVWNRAQASRLIESLIIQCPIPVIYLNQETDERLSVVDGNQRLTSIKLYLEGDFALQGLTAYPELEGLYFNDLDPRFQRHISNRTLRCITILKETHPQIKFDVFERINTGAVQLTPQEIRHGIYYGKLANLADELAREKIWKQLSGIRKDTRMKGNEHVLRFIALYKNRDSYKKPLKKFLNDFCETHRNISEEEKLKLRNKFLNTLETVNTLFGKNAFRVLDNNFTPVTTSINAALYDATMVSIAECNVYQEDAATVDIRKFNKDYAKMLSETKFKASIESGTSATKSVRYRIDRFSELLEKYF